MLIAIFQPSMLGRGSLFVRRFAGLKLMLRNLPWAATKDEVTSSIKAVVQFERLDLPINLDGRNRGFAFVSFASEAEKEKAAAALATFEFGGRKIVVHEAIERPRAERADYQRRTPSGEPKQN